MVTSEQTVGNLVLLANPVDGLITPAEEQLQTARIAVFDNFLGRLMQAEVALPPGVITSHHGRDPSFNTAVEAAGGINSTYTNILYNQMAATIPPPETAQQAPDFAIAVADTINGEAHMRIAVHEVILQHANLKHRILESLMAKPIHDPTHVVTDLLRNGKLKIDDPTEALPSIRLRILLDMRMQMMAEESATRTILNGGVVESPQAAEANFRRGRRWRRRHGSAA